MSERLAPMQFDSLPDTSDPSETVKLAGHAEIVTQIAAAYRSGKMHHGLLLTGPKGIGKATFAFHLARYLLANPNETSAPMAFEGPDPRSALWRQVASGAHPGVLHLTRPWDEKSKKFKAAITVDEVRRVGRFLSLRAHDDGYRVVIVDPADDMNRNAANALLKNLEEPPARALFILISHAPGGLLPTIRSRCQVIRFAPLEPADLAAAVQASGAPLPTDPAQHRAVLQGAGGSVRQAILLAAHGGLDIADAVGRHLSSNPRDPALAKAISDAVAGRDQQVPFDIFNDHLLDRIADTARAAAEAGDARGAARLAELWHVVETRIGETATYNLDKREHVTGLLATVAQALSH